MAIVSPASAQSFGSLYLQQKNHVVLKTYTISQVLSQFSVFPVGLNVNKRTVLSGVLVRGQEDGKRTIDFNSWLLPFDAVVTGLKLNVTNLPDGQLEVRSREIVTRINPKQLQTDPELGLVFSIQEIETLFGVKAEFNFVDYAINLELSWNNQTRDNFGKTDTPIDLEGLTRLQPAKLNLTAVEQKVNINGSGRISPSYAGNLMAVGTAFGGSWFIRSNQPDLPNQQTWQIAEAQYLLQGVYSDLIVGSQAPFWPSQGTGDYWGLTYIQRQGFISPQTSGSAINSRQRLQSASIARTISGFAEPGTLVRLVQGFNERVVGDVLLDSSGRYRFENIKTYTVFGNNYRILLYPQGRLTAKPEIRDATFTTVPGQIPPATSGLIVSGGWGRKFTNRSLLGSFSDFRGGISQRWGLSENLTIGVGGVYDQELRGLLELFYRPKNIPLQVIVASLSGNQWDLLTNIRYEPFSNLSAELVYDQFSSRGNVSWAVSPHLYLFGNIDSLKGASGDIKTYFSGKNTFTFARASLDSTNHWQWNLSQRFHKLELNLQGNNTGISSQFTYNLSPLNSSGGHSIALSYDELNQRQRRQSDRLLTLGWVYRSPARTVDGTPLWEAKLGYGMGSQENGLISSLSTTILPGLLLRGQYQGISLTTDQPSFSINLVSSLNFQRGITPANRRSEYLRTQGGLLIQSFFDINGNGKRDSNEKFYLENPELMFLLNNKQLKSFKLESQGNRLLVQLPPGRYRLDLDPSGFPLDWKVTTNALAVDVVAGSYTPVIIPLVRSYICSGVVTDMQKKPVAGATIEAIQPDTNKRSFSVTNSAGVYYLEGLEQGHYILQINGKPAGNLKLDAASEPLQELNLQTPGK